jgi:hypothetical protein
MYYYVQGTSQDSKPFFAGPLTKEMANEVGMNNCGSNFEIFELETRDPNRARRQINYIRNSRGEPLSKVFQRNQVYHSGQQMNKKQYLLIIWK